jgi:hypothetical protein
MRINHNWTKHIWYISEVTDKLFPQGKEVMSDWQNSSPVVSYWSEASQLQMRCETTGSNVAPCLESRTLERAQLHWPSQGVHSCNGWSMTTVTSSCLMCLHASSSGSKISFLPVLYTENFWEILSMLILSIYLIIYLFTYLFIYLFIYLFVYLFIYSIPKSITRVHPMDIGTVKV